MPLRCVGEYFWLSLSWYCIMHDNPLWVDIIDVALEIFVSLAFVILLSGIYMMSVYKWITLTVIVHIFMSPHTISAWVTDSQPDVVSLYSCLPTLMSACKWNHNACHWPHSCLCIVVWMILFHNLTLSHSIHVFRHWCLRVNEITTPVIDPIRVSA
jgi:hypothetical protein